ncbi:MAG: hypothetical protein J6T10_28985 [Methanobrevibacter sp.]|nr:hypothetical protein [Methanobrevibacter sp.]
MLYNVNSYNVDVAKKLGVFSSIYISFIDKLLIRNEKLMLSRTQIYDYTGISESKQEDAERELVSYGVMEINGPRTNSNKRSYNINYDRLNAIVSGEEDINCAYVFLTDPPKKEKNVSKETKREQLLKKLKGAIKVDDEVLEQHLCDWVDSVIDGGKYLTVQSIKINVEQLLKYTSSQTIAIQVVDMATKNCWRDLEWAMNKVNPCQNSKNNFADYSSIASNGSDLVGEAF